MIAHDLTFAWRLFARRPAFAGIAVLILALRIGASTTIFSWMQTVLFSPLNGVPRQDRILVINAGMLGIVAAVACAVPAWRVSRLGPPAALRLD